MITLNDYGTVTITRGRRTKTYNATDASIARLFRTLGTPTDRTEDEFTWILF